MTEWLVVILASAGTLFYLSGSVGLLRLPDSYSRLHALTKADNLGLGLLVGALLLQAGDGWEAGKLLLVWLLALAASAVNAFLIAGHLRRRTRHGD